MSLYNKERPTSLSEIKGQDKVILPIKAAIQSGNIPNVWLFVGLRGTGKTTVARIVAQALNCEHPNPDGSACGTCPACKAIAGNNSLDVIELDAASNNKVEDAHSIIEATRYTPIGKCKVFILDEPHMFSVGAWNALLKTFEEPPKNCYFILCTTEENKVPATIVSRSRKFHFERIDILTIVNYLKELCGKYHKAYEEDALQLIAKAADGSMRDALSILEGFFDNDSLTTSYVEQALGMTRNENICTMLEAIGKGDISSVMSLLNEVERKGQCSNYLKDFLCVLSDLLYVIQDGKTMAVTGTPEYKERLLVLKNSFSLEYCLHLNESFMEIYQIAIKSGDAYFVMKSSLLTIFCKESYLMKIAQEVKQLSQELNDLKNGKMAQEKTVSIKETEISIPKESKTFPASESVIMSDESSSAEPECNPVSSDSLFISEFDIASDGFSPLDTLPGDTYTESACDSTVASNISETTNDSESMHETFQEADTLESPLLNGHKVAGTFSLDSLPENPKEAPKETPADTSTNIDIFGDDMFAGFVRL